MKADPFENSHLSLSKTPKYPSAAVFLMDLICCPLMGEKQPNEDRLWGTQAGKEGDESAHCSLITLFLPY